MAVVHKEHENWTSRFAFLMAAVGAAVGLGNIWKFPYIAGQNGGGAFVAVYLLAVVFVALPILIAEVMLGRWGKQSPPNAMINVAKSQGRSSKWSLVGWLGKVGFKDARVVDVSVTSTDEQRSTEWMTFHSLKDFLDPEDPSKTIEGYPAPTRAIVTAYAA